MHELNIKAKMEIESGQETKGGNMRNPKFYNMAGEFKFSL